MTWKMLDGKKRIINVDNDSSMMNMGNNIFIRIKDSTTIIPTSLVCELTSESSPDKNVECLRTELLKRSEVGYKKYGVTTERDDIDTIGWIQHLKEELLDGAVYCKRIQQNIRK